VIFSIFGKKEKAGTRRRDGDTAIQRNGPATGPHTSTASTTSVSQREIARRTAEKIDLIESQMDLAIPARVSKSVPGQENRSDSLPPAAAQRPLPAGIDEGGMVRFPAANGQSGPAGAGNRLSRLPVPDPSTSVILGDTGGKHSMEVLTSGLLPVFEEAAVLYSNGQSNEAAMILWQAIKENQLGQHIQQAWRMMFELYQAGGRRPEFESLAIDYASRFESSPPTWSDDLSPPVVTEVRTFAASSIVFPPRLDAQAIKQIEQMQRAAQRNRAAEVDLSKVTSVDAVGANLLLRVLVDFRKNGGHMTLAGVEELRAALSSAISNGRRDPSDACWLLKLETLRFLGEQQRFEDLAIDYCVTYEVSPPSWEPMPGSIRLHNSTAEAARVPQPASPTDDAFPLEGELDGRPDAIFKSLRAYSQAHPEIVLDCRRLRRMDFVCAGEMLNEVAALRSAGKFLVFKDLTYLVACLMMVMGIHDLAELNLRTA
jgi:anti-anti-sigma regulatory factor